MGEVSVLGPDVVAPEAELYAFGIIAEDDYVEAGAVGIDRLADGVRFGIELDVEADGEAVGRIQCWEG